MGGQLLNLIKIKLKPPLSRVQAQCPHHPIGKVTFNNQLSFYKKKTTINLDWKGPENNLRASKIAITSTSLDSLTPSFSENISWTSPFRQDCVQVCFKNSQITRMQQLHIFLASFLHYSLCNSPKSWTLHVSWACRSHSTWYSAYDWVLSFLVYCCIFGFFWQIEAQKCYTTKEMALLSLKINPNRSDLHHWCSADLGEISIKLISISAA